MICIGLRWQGLAPGLALAYLLGSSADVLSGSLMGLHALLSMLTFLSAVFAGRQLNLKGLFPLMAFAASVSLFYGLALYAVSIFLREWDPIRSPMALGKHSSLVGEWFVRPACLRSSLSARRLGWGG